MLAGLALQHHAAFALGLFETSAPLVVDDNLATALFKAACPSFPSVATVAIPK